MELSFKKHIKHYFDKDEFTFILVGYSAIGMCIIGLSNILGMFSNKALVILILFSVILMLAIVTFVSISYCSYRDNLKKIQVCNTYDKFDVQDTFKMFNDLSDFTDSPLTINFVKDFNLLNVKLTGNKMYDFYVELANEPRLHKVFLEYKNILNNEDASIFAETKNIALKKQTEIFFDILSKEKYKNDVIFKSNHKNILTLDNVIEEFESDSNMEDGVFNNNKFINSILNRGYQENESLTRIREV